MTSTKRPRPNPLSARQSSGPQSAAVRWPAWLGPVLAAVAALFVYRRVLGAYFSPDDFLLMERVRHLVEAPTTLWRFLSGTVYWTVATHLFGGDPVPYHAVMWLLHAANAAMVFVLARRMGSGWPVAMLGSGLFATSRLFFSALYPASSIGEVLALSFALGALVTLERTLSGRSVLLATLLFAAGLLCKESVALLPLAWVVGSRREPWSRRLVAVAPLMGAALLLAIVLLMTRDHIGSLGGDIYAWSLGGHVLANLAGFTGAAMDVIQPAPEPGAAGMVQMGTVVGIALLVLAILTWRRSRLPMMGLVGWLAGLAPVLPLEHVRYAHYSYAPAAFLAIGVASLVSLLPDLARRTGGNPEASSAPHGGVAATLAMLAVFAHAAMSELALATRHAWRMEAMDLPFDSTLRKMEFSRRVIEGIRAVAAAESVRVAWVLPTGTERVVSVRSGRAVEQQDSSTPRYNFVTAILDSGRAVRAVLPQVTDLRIVDRWSPELAGSVVVTNRIDGWMTVHGVGPQAHGSLVGSWWQAGLRDQAEVYLASVIESEPDTNLVALLQQMRELSAAGTGPVQQESPGRAR